MIIRNFQILKLMTDIVKEDNLAFFFPFVANGCLFRDDSSHSSQCSTSSGSSLQDWSSEERKARILQKIDNTITALNDDEGYVHHSWEDIVFPV